MVSNLLGNAVCHGSQSKPVLVTAAIKDGGLNISVANGGDLNPEATREKLFQPFSHGAAGTSQQGLGLGLYIASQIAEAHGGRLEVASDEQETRLTFTMVVESGKISR